jgi:hypothetical protein
VESLQQQRISRPAVQSCQLLLGCMLLLLLLLYMRWHSSK